MSSDGVQWSGDTEAKPAPEPLRRVQALINTIDLESGQDRLGTIEDARPWLVDQGLLAPGATVDASELRLATGVREGLRALARHDSGGPTPDPAVIAPLRHLADEGRVRMVLDGRGRLDVGPDGDSMPARLLAVLLIVRDAQLDGTWVHLKVCANGACLWAFYDRSRNHGGTWCDMASCGNKLKNRDFRARRRQRD